MLKTSRIIQLAEIQGRKRKWLAAKCGISVGSLNHALGGRRNLSVAVVMHLAETLGTTVEDISHYQVNPTTEVRTAS